MGAIPPSNTVHRPPGVPRKMVDNPRHLENPSVHREEWTAQWEERAAQFAESAAQFDESAALLEERAPLSEENATLSRESGTEKCASARHLEECTAETVACKKQNRTPIAWPCEYTWPWHPAFQIWICVAHS